MDISNPDSIKIYQYVSCLENDKLRLGEFQIVVTFATFTGESLNRKFSNEQGHRNTTKKWGRVTKRQFSF